MVFIIPALVGLFLLAAALINDERAKKLVLGVPGFLLVAVAVILIILQFAAAQDREEEWSVASSEKIASLANASEVKGQSSGFVTKVSEENVLRYVRDHGDGSYSLEEIPADGVLIREDADAKTARVDEEECVRIGVDPESAFASCGDRTVVHVPKSSVVSDFTIDPGA